MSRVCNNYEILENVLAIFFKYDLQMSFYARRLTCGRISQQFGQILNTMMFGRFEVISPDVYVVQFCPLFQGSRVGRPIHNNVTLESTIP